MNAFVLCKTDKGRDEIMTRKYHLDGRLRRCLVLVDGRHSRQELLDCFAGIGVSEESIRDLLDNRFIEAVAAQGAPDEAARVPTAAVGGDAAAEPDAIPETVRKFQVAYQFYTQTIKSALGLRGFALQLKVERAASLEELRRLREEYLAALLKSKGKEIARSLGDSLDQVLG